MPEIPIGSVLLEHYGMSLENTIRIYEHKKILYLYSRLNNDVDIYYLEDTPDEVKKRMDKLNKYMNRKCKLHNNYWTKKVRVK